MTKEKALSMSIYGSLMCLALGLFTSMTFLALTHILIAIPCIYFIPRTDFKKWNKSIWLLLIMAIIFILSVLANHDIAARGFSPIGKMKYYFLAIFSIAPFSWYFSTLSNEERALKINKLLKALFITMTFAGLCGMFEVIVGFHPFIWREKAYLRNSGLAGMVLNYAHNLAIIQVITTGMIYYRNDVKKYINLNFLYIIWFVNLIALYMTYSRGPLLAFIAAVPFYLFKKNKKYFTALCVTSALLLGAAYTVYGNPMARPESDRGRMSQWMAAVEAFKERPVLGFGYLNFEPHSQKLKDKLGIVDSEFTGHAHNNYLEILASTGIVGFIFFILWQTCWIIEMYKRDDIISNLALPVIVCFIVGGLTQASITLGANLFLSMSLYALTQLNVNIIKNKT